MSRLLLPAMLVVAIGILAVSIAEYRDASAACGEVLDIWYEHRVLDTSKVPFLIEDDELDYLNNYNFTVVTDE